MNSPNADEIQRTNREREMVLAGNILPVVPITLTDNSTGKSFRITRFLGKGAFGQCYAMVDIESKEIFALKALHKKRFVKESHQDKLEAELEIHQQLAHKRVVRCYGVFEDDDFIFMILELCRNGSLMDLLKKNIRLKEPVVRTIMKQILEGVSYLHRSNIIHRDLKPNNIFLDDKLLVKIGDFGLAVRIEYSDQRKMCFCGSRYFIAPEMIKKKGHSFEVDVWAIGCIMYTLLVGRPPFEGQTLADIQKKILNNDYVVPEFVSETATTIIRQMLHPDSSQRPTVEQMLQLDYYQSWTHKIIGRSTKTARLLKKKKIWH